MYWPRPYDHVSDLPAALPVFPLTGALLLPRGQLPLNVFEPRYLAMVDAVLAGERMIGMIQPLEDEGKKKRPALMAVGCAGRLTGYQEAEDGRYLITLTGICRFRIAQELRVKTAFRQVQPDYAPFAADLQPPPDEGEDFPRAHIIASLKTYLAKNGMDADFSAMADPPPEALVNALSMLCPFEPQEKQALLEAPDWQARVQALIALLEMSGMDAPGSAMN